ncbi:MAG: hypothetical protein K6C99_01090 [Lachnospiraceae bacterium]|nr:hypothetical protein [Lachnospiraceae bacterium]
MEPTALYIGNLQVGWSSFIIILAALVWLCCACSLVGMDGGRKYVIWVSFPFAVVFSLFIARFLNWYCHPEMYGSLKGAMASLMQKSDVGGFEMPGVLAGIIIAAIIAGRIKDSGGTLYLLDVMAPGTALGMALLYLTDRFGIGCRGKVTFDAPPVDPELFLYVYDGTSYRMALYMIQFIVLLLIFALTLLFRFKWGDRVLINGRGEGSTAVLFMLLLSAAEVPLDSARYDTSFLRSNGFVSFMQIISALVFLSVMVICSIRSVKAKRLRVLHWIIWVVFAAALGGTIYCEYLVQRHGSWYVTCYSWMSVCCIVMAVVCIILHISNFADEEHMPEAEPEGEAVADAADTGEVATVETDKGEADTFETDTGETVTGKEPAVMATDTASFDTKDLVLLDINNGTVQRFEKSYHESPEEKEYRKALAESLGIISEYEDDYIKERKRVAGSETYAFNTETMNDIRRRYSCTETDEPAKKRSVRQDAEEEKAVVLQESRRPAPRTTFPTNISVYTRDKRTWKKRRKR